MKRLGLTPTLQAYSYYNEGSGYNEPVNIDPVYWNAPLITEPVKEYYTTPAPVVINDGIVYEEPVYQEPIIQEPVYTAPVESVPVAVEEPSPITETPTPATEMPKRNNTALLIGGGLLLFLLLNKKKRGRK